MSDPLLQLDAPEFSLFSALPKQQRSKVVARERACRAIDDAGRGETMREVLRQATALGISESDMRHLYYAKWRGRDHHRNWQALVDGRSRRSSLRETKLPAAFEQYIRGLFEQHQRDHMGREVHRLVIRRWKLWLQTNSPQHAIPGYDHPPAPQLSGLPAGWSHRTFLRCRPSRYNKILTSLGPKAASALLPSVLTTRVGLKFFQRVFFDDQQYDNRVVVPGYRDKEAHFIPLGFNALDHFSGEFVDWVIKVRHAGDDGKMKSLDKHMFTWFVLRILTEIGYRNDAAGTQLIFEHGTADAWRNQAMTSGSGHHTFDEAISFITHGSVTIDRSGRFGDPAFKEMFFRGQSSGNFRYKSPLEGMFNLVRNRFAALPSQTGRHYQLKPEEMPGIEAEDKQLLSIWNDLPPERRELLSEFHFHALTFQEFCLLARDIYRSINQRRDHALEGWEKLGFAEPVWTIDGQNWLPRERLLDLPPERRDVAASIADWTTRRLSPTEVRQRHQSELTRLHWSCIPLAMPIEWARPAVVGKKYTIEIKDALIDPEPMVFIASAETPTGRSEDLAPGDQVLCYLNPFSPDAMVIADTKGSVIGRLTRFIRPTAGDTSAIYPHIHRIERLRNRLSIPSELGAASLMEERSKMLDLRKALQNGDPITPEEKAEALSDARSNSARLGQSTRRSNASGIDDSHWDPEPVAAPSSSWADACSPEGPDDDDF